MNFFKISIKRIEANINKAIPSASGDNVKEGKNLFRLIGKHLILHDPVPFFDYFQLQSYEDDEKEWELIKNDVHAFIGEASIIQGWFVSDKIKGVLEKFSICKPYKFYPSKLLYKGLKYDYSIFETSYEILDEIIFTESKFILRKGVLDPQIVGDFESVIIDKNDFLKKNEEVYLMHKFRLFPAEVKLKNKYDLIFFKGFEN